MLAFLQRGDQMTQRGDGAADMCVRACTCVRVCLLGSAVNWKLWLV